MGSGNSRASVTVSPVQSDDALDVAYARARAKVLKAGGPKTPAALANALLDDDATTADDGEDAHVIDEDTHKTLGKAATDGRTVTNFWKKMVPADGDTVAKAKVIAQGLDAKKKVLMVIDVQDGYDGDFVSSLPADAPGSLGYIQSKHDIRQSVELASQAPIEQFAAGQKRIKLDKVWNRGLDGASFGRVTDRVVKEIKVGGYDFICFTYDYLEKSTGDEKGVFPLDKTPWSDPKKPVALVAYGKYLTINAGGCGTDVSGRIRRELPEVTNARGADNTVLGTPCLYIRKQVDDGFNERRETSERTRGESWLDDIDLDDNGLPQPKAQSLVEKLTARGLGPDEATLHFVGVVTNRCVASTLLHGVSLGYEAVLLEGGCCAADDKQHVDGVKNIREKGGAAVEVRP